MMKMKSNRLIAIPLIALPLLFASCEEKTGTEKAADAIEEAGEDVSDAIKDATN